MACSNIGYGSGLVHHLSELRIVLVGSVQSGKSSAGNTILGQETFSLKTPVQCLKRQGEVAGRKITVVEAPGWWDDRLVEDSTNLLKEEILFSALQCPPGPHAVLLVVRLILNFTDIDRKILEGYLNLFGDQVWSHTILLFTVGDSLGDISIEQYIEFEGKALKLLVEKCGNRYHAFMNENKNHMQVTELLDKIEKMVEGNGGHHFETGTRFFQELEERRRVEEERSVERRMKASKQREDIRKHMRATDHLPKLRIVLLGCRNSGKSSAGNIILRREAFNLNRAVESVIKEGNAADRKVTVVEAPGWWRDRPVEESTKFLRQEIVRSVSMPTPHAILVVVNGDRIFTEKDREILSGYIKLLDDKIWSHTIVLFTFGDSLGDTTIERHIESEGEALQWLVEKCGNRYHVFNNMKTDDDSQVIELLEKIEEMLAGNRGCQMGTNILQEVKHESLKKQSKKEKKSKVLLEDCAGSIEHLSEVRLVLLGCRTAGKSSAGNTILGQEEFNLQGSAKCVKKQGKVAGRKIIVVEAPGWQRNKAVKNLLKQEIVLSASLCPPGPHAVLLIVRLDFKSWESEKNSFEGYMKLLTKRAWSHSIVLFTFGDCIKDQPIEQYIESRGKALQWLVGKCENRYHVFNNTNRNDNTQVTELLEKIEKMVVGNRGSHLEIDSKILQEIKRRNKAEEERSKERRRKVSMKRIFIRENMFHIHRLSEVRIVLLGYRNAGKSSSGNTILGTDVFEFNQSDKCVKRRGVVAGRFVTVVKAPGWQRNKAERNSTDVLKQEIAFSVSMCQPHAVLLVVCLDFKFREKQRKALVQHLNLLGDKVWSYTIVLFTFGDSLGDTTIERHIESEGEALQWLVEKCGNRYHVFNNQNRHDDTQVRELLKKIEEMVAENRDFEKLQNFEKRRRADKEKDRSLRKKQLDAQVIDMSNQSYWSTPPVKFPEGSSPFPFQDLGRTFAMAASYEDMLQFSSHFPWIPSISQKHHSAYTELLTPELVESCFEDKHRDAYRIFCPSRIQITCKLTNLAFEMEGKGEVLYRIVPWDSHVLDGLGQMEPAGPLYSIDCLEGSIRYLHLPHCETRKDVVKLTVAHVTGGNVEIIQPLEVTNTHVIISIQGLSLFGLLREWLFQVYPIKAQVLLFYNKWMSTLYIHLLPGNVPVEEVQKRQEGNMYIKTSSKCQLIPGKMYQPCCQTSDHDYVSQPEDETFDCDYGPNYHPTFEVLFGTEVNKVSLSLLDEYGQVVWKPRMVLLKGKARASPRMETGANFVDQHREELIRRVSSVMEIADCLKSREMISLEMYDKIHVQPTSQEQMRLLYKSLDSGGRTVKAEFYKILKEKQPFIVDDLESGSSLA